MTIDLCEDVVLVDPPILPDVVEAPSLVEVVVEFPNFVVVSDPTPEVEVRVDQPILPEVGLSFSGPVGPAGPQGEQGPEGPVGPPGPNADAAAWISEVPTGAIDSVNQAFFTAQHFTAGTTRVYLNGLRQTFQVNYNESGVNRLDLFFSPHPGDELIVDYIRA